MRNHLLAALGSKVVIGGAATVLAFGTAGAVLALQPVSDNSPSHSGGPFVAADETTTTTSTTVAPTTTSTTSTTVAPTTTTTTVARPATKADDDGANHDVNDDHGNEAAEIDDHDDGPNHDVQDEQGQHDDSDHSDHRDHRDHGTSGADHAGED
jgi:hypothetical protein